MADPNETTSLVEQARQEPDFEAIQTSISGVIEMARQVGRAAEHEQAGTAEDHFAAMIRLIGKTAAHFQSARFQQISRELVRAASGLGEERESSPPVARLRKRV